jgi:hypothetical protein
VFFPKGSAKIPERLRKGSRRFPKGSEGLPKGRPTVEGLLFFVFFSEMLFWQGLQTAAGLLSSKIRPVALGVKKRKSREKRVAWLSGLEIVLVKKVFLHRRIYSIGARAK